MFTKTLFPDIITKYEVLNTGKIPYLNFLRGSAATRRYLETLFSTLQGKLVSGNFHLSQLRYAGVSAADLRAWFPRSRFLICYRKSLLDQFVSLKLAEHTGRWRADHSHEETDESITIDPKELSIYCQTIKREYASVVRQLSSYASDCLLVVTKM